MMAGFGIVVAIASFMGATFSQPSTPNFGDYSTIYPYPPEPATYPLDTPGDGLLRLSYARTHAGAVLLSSGYVLVVGGSNDVGTLSSAELFDPTNGQFIFGGNLMDPRSDPMMVALGDGQALVAGGKWSRTVLASAEVYVGGAEPFTSVMPMSTPRVGGTATVLADGRVLVAGGFGVDGAALASAEIFDPVSRTWSPTGSMSRGRAQHVAARLLDGRVLVAGGVPSYSTTTMEIYDPKTGEFSGLTGIAPTESGAAVTLPSGLVAIVGRAANPNSLIQIYDPASGAIQSQTAVTLGNSIQGAVLMANGHVICISEGFPPAELDPSTGEVFVDVALDPGAEGEAVVLLADGRLITLGGSPDGSSTDRVDIFALNGGLLSPVITAP